ncbi:MAG: helix-turn-helix domain-containing protein [Clostridia bacterium]|nr:helix-turn-helix domain-containing protein [Clostridia bacterium]
MFGENFKKYRKRAGLTQEEVAKILMVTPQAVSKWETGNGTPDISFLVPIAELFDISTDDLLGRSCADVSAELLAIDENNEKNIKDKYEECKRLLKENPGKPEVLRGLLSHIAEHFEHNCELSKDEKDKLVSDAENYAEMILSNPQCDSLYPYTHRRLADVYMYAGQYDKAEEEISHIPETNISRSVMKGKLLIQKKRHKESREHLKKALASDITTLIWSIRRLSEAYADEFEGNKRKIYKTFDKPVFEILHTLYGGAYPYAPCFASFCWSGLRLALAAAGEGGAGEPYYYLDIVINAIRRYCKNEKAKNKEHIFSPESIDTEGYRKIPQKRELAAYLLKPAFNRIRDEGKFRHYLKEIDSWE